MSLIADLIGGFLGHKDDKKVNKMTKEQLQIQKDLADRQIELSKYMEELSRQAAGMKGNFTNPYGSGAVYDPATGTWKTQLSPEEKAVQDASYKEELARNTHDQEIRRKGLDDFEKMRERSSTEATGALHDINAFKRGFGKLDEASVGAQMRNDRVGAVNAGYDDAARAAQTLQLRTGNSAIGDALTDIARNRVRDTMQVGSPELEGIQFAQGINDKRSANLYDIYKGFGDEARGFYDAQFAPSGYAQNAYNAGTDAQKFDLSKLDLAMGGSGQAASTIGQASQGINTGYNTMFNNRIANPTGKFIMGASNSIEDAIGQLFSGGMSFGG